MKRRGLAFQALAFALATSLITACGGGGGGSAPPTTAPTTTPTTGPTTGPSADFVCPTSDAASAARIGSSGQILRRPVSRARIGTESSGLIAVEYASVLAGTNRKAAAARVATAQATVVREMTFTHVNRTVQILKVDPKTSASVVRAMQTMPGVRTVAELKRRSTLTVSGPLFTNDPFFTGFPTTIPTNPPGPASPAPTFSAPPYYENANVPGQWDTHVTGLEFAFEYSNPNNGSGVSNANAMGSSVVHIAVIDTGQDTTHPELQGKIVYQRCFITDPSGTQSTSNFTTDPMGHGTDVSGIAADKTNNALGFTGAGGNVSLLGYRVFPTPDDTCLQGSTQQDDTCTASSLDIASAIDDAVAQHANVISISLGSCCGADTPPESTAVANAIAANIIVVAAAGNDNGSTTYTPGGPVETSIDAPANNPGVIAVGASALNDGVPNGANYTGPNPEYIASYSDYANVNLFRSTTSWGIVAPGGDPAASETVEGAPFDYLHWITNIWTSTPFTQNDAGNCSGDYPSGTGTPVCRVLIVGTSMSTPHVAGSAGLILSVTGGRGSAYQNPARMYQLLCGTADNIGSPHQGCGRLNIYRAMAIALRDQVPP